MNSEKTDPITTDYETRKAYGIYISVTDARCLVDWRKRFDDEIEIVEVAVGLEDDVRHFTYEDFFRRLGFDTAIFKDNAS